MTRETEDIRIILYCTSTSATSTSTVQYHTCTCSCGRVDAWSTGREEQKRRLEISAFFRCSWTFLQRDRAREAFSLLSGRRARDTRTRRRWDSSPKRASRMSVGTRHLCPMPPCPHLRPTFVIAQLFVNLKRGGAREKEKKGRKKVARSCGGLRAKSLCQQRIEVIARHERDRVPASYLNLSLSFLHATLPYPCFFSADACDYA